MLTEFIIANWHLFAMLVVIVFLLALNPGSGGAKKISPLQVPQLQNRESAIVVDVGQVNIFNKGHIAQSINIPLEQLKEKSTPSLTKLTKHKNKPIIIACQNGARSAKAAGMLRKTFDKLYLLDGGIAAWQKENLPLMKK